MAFSDEDIAANGPKGFGSVSSTGSACEGVDTHTPQSRRDPLTGEGIESHRRKSKREWNDKWTLADVGDRSKGSIGTIHWGAKRVTLSHKG